MTVLAGYCDVRTGQWELCRGVVVESCPQPLFCVVTGGAVLRESCQYMVRILCAVEIGQVAGNAIACRQGEIAVGVTAPAVDANVSARERKGGDAVIERRALPIRGVVARRTIGRKLALDVIGIFARVEIHAVTRIAVHRRTRVSAIGVTGIALEGRVGARQGELGESAVVELCSLPAVCCVTERAFFGQS